MTTTLDTMIYRKIPAPEGFIQPLVNQNVDPETMIRHQSGWKFETALCIMAQSLYTGFFLSRFRKDPKSEGKYENVQYPLSMLSTGVPLEYGIQENTLREIKNNIGWHFAYKPKFEDWAPSSGGI